MRDDRHTHPIGSRRTTDRIVRAASLSLITVVIGLGVIVPKALARPVLFVGNYKDGTVTLIDATALKVIGTINVTPDGKTPRDPVQALAYPFIVAAKGPNYAQGLAVSPDGATLYVSRGYLGDVAAFDIASRRLLWRVEASGLRADHVALSPDGSRLFVSALTSNEVQVIDTSTHSFVGSFPTGDWPHVLAFTPDHRQIVNGSLGNQLLPSGVPTRFEMTFADPITRAVTRRLSFSAGVRPFVFSPDGNLAYVQFSYFNGFKVVATANGQIVHTVNLPVEGPGATMQPSQYPNQAAHHGIDISGDSSTICDAGTISNYVALVDRGSLQTDAIVAVGDQPADALTSLDGGYCFVTNRGPGPGGNSVSVISYSARAEVARIATGGNGSQEQTEAIIPDTVLRAAGMTLPANAATVRRPAPRGTHRHRRRGTHRRRAPRRAHRRR